VTGKFLVCAVAFLRAKQLADGARPRVDHAGHKLERLAICEVMADAVSWSQI
jgi:DNA-directed RNA polymerase subunit K/omega